MFPSFANLLNYLLGINVNLPIQTLGFFIALSFALTYIVFSSEFKRKEAEGLIHAFKTKVIIGEPASITEIAINALLGFIFGFKIIGCLLQYKIFVANPPAFIFSAQGNLWLGLLGAAGWAYWAYIDKQKQRLPKPQIVEEKTHPYQLMFRITFWAGFWGFIGAKLFDTIEHLGYFLQHPVADLLSSNGFTYYGGFIFGALSYLYIGHKRGMKLLILADIGSPGMILAYGIGRIGCQLSGDGDWGIVNTAAKPGWLNWLPNWMWSFNFPHNVANQGIYINGCAGNNCMVLQQGVFPTSFYEVVLCMLMFIFIWLIRKHVKIPGIIFFIFLVLTGLERFLIENIRVTIKYDIMGCLLTQAQLISLGMIALGISGLIVIYLQHSYQQAPRARYI